TSTFRPSTSSSPAPRPLRRPCDPLPLDRRHRDPRPPGRRRDAARRLRAGAGRVPGGDGDRPGPRGGRRRGRPAPRGAPGLGGPDDAAFDPAGPAVGVVFYRAHLLAGNTTFVDDLCAALQERGANALACWCYSLRPDERGDVPVISRYLEGRVDAVVTTVLAM